MSADNTETLFSLELLVDHIRLDEDRKVPDRLALGVRLLDFPTLLIHQRRSNKKNPPDGRREFPFNRGKSCFFKMNLDWLHVHLSATPLHVMVLDETEEGNPGWVGSSLISLAEAMDGIKQLSSPSARTGKGVAAIRGLSGEKVGTISMSYKLVSLGASLLPHITDGRGYICKNTPGGQSQERSKEKMTSGSMCSPEGNKSGFSNQTNEAGDSNALLDEYEEDDSAESQTSNTFEEDLTVFRPPHLYYTNTTQAKSGNTEQDYRLFNPDPEAFTFDDSLCEDEEDNGKAGGSVSRSILQKSAHATKTSSSRGETSEVTPNILGEALQRLPLLNALVAELSQLIAHPNPARITRTASDGRDQSLHRSTHLPDTHSNCFPAPRSCSTPIANPLKVKDDQLETLSSRKSGRKRLVYGTTKTFNLRLRRIAPLKTNNRECLELMKRGTQPKTAKEKEKSSSKTIKSKKRGFSLSRSSNLDENVETVMQSLTVGSAMRETVTLKPKTRQGARDCRAQGVSEDFHPLKELKCIPSVHRDGVPLGKHKHRSESDQSDSDSDGDKLKVLVPDFTEKQSSGSNTPASLFSECSVTENGAHYADDFDSLESSNASSTEPDRSPEACTSDSTTGGFQKGSGHRPSVVAALRPPRRALMGTHIIQPRTCSSALSFSSDADGCVVDSRSSSQTVGSRNQTNAGDKLERRSSAESFLSPGSEEKNSPRSSNRIRGFSALSTSSFDAQGVEELEDELGSLDFRKGYQHISDLVASKLPGYTM